MFEEEDSEEELVAEDSVKSPSKMKKHSKPSFKFPKRDKLYKPKEKDKDRDRDGQHGPHYRDKDRWGGGERGEVLGGLKESKKKEDKQKWRKRKPLGQGVNTNLGVTVVKAESSKVQEEPDVKPVFSVPLAVAVDRSKCHDGIQLPVIVRECIDYIEEFGLLCEGIYRISGVKSKVQSLKDAYNQRKSVFLHEHEPNIVASLLKLFLRELPEPVLTKELMPKFEEASTVSKVKQKVEQFQQLIEQLPVANKLLLSWMIVHMTHVIAKEKQNKMSLQNVSIVLSPTMQISHRVLNVLFTYARILFKDTIIKRHVPPLKPGNSHWSLDLPESPSALEEELIKQESLLNQLHEQVMKVKDSDKEEQLWEVQRVVTQLKRKIKNMKKSKDLHTIQGIMVPDKVRNIQPQSQVTTVTVSEKLKGPTPPQRHKTSIAKSSIEVKKTPEPVEKLDFDIKQVEVEVEATKTEESTSDNVSSEEQRDATPKELDEETTKPPEEADSQEQMKDDPEQTEEAVPSPDPEVEKEAPSEVVEEVPAEEPDKEATPEVESPLPSSDTLEMELDGEDDEIKNVEPLPEDDVPTSSSEPFQEQFAQGMQLDDGSILVAPPGDGIVQTPPVYQQQLSASSEEGSQGTRDIYEPNKIVSSETSDAEDSQTSDETDYDVLQQQYNELMLEEEELRAMGDELRQKIETEKSEMERLHQEIVELKSIREDLYESDLASSDSSDDEEDEEELREILRELQLKNRQLEIDNRDLSANVQEERQICLDVKVQIRMIQQRQLESSGGMLLMDGISESDALIDSLL